MFASVTDDSNEMVSAQADDSALPASAVPGAPVSAEPPFQAPEQATDGLPAQGEPDAHLGDAAEVEVSKSLPSFKGVLERFLKTLTFIVI